MFFCSPTFSSLASPRRCYSEVLQVLCRCLCLPIWRENDSEAVSLAQDIQRFFDIYERNLDRDLVGRNRGNREYVDGSFEIRRKHQLRDRLVLSHYL